LCHKLAKLLQGVALQSLQWYRAEAK